MKFFSILSFSMLVVLLHFADKASAKKDDVKQGNKPGGNKPGGSGGGSSGGTKTTTLANGQTAVQIIPSQTTSNGSAMSMGIGSGGGGIGTGTSPPFVKDGAPEDGEGIGANLRGTTPSTAGITATYNANKQKTSKSAGTTSPTTSAPTAK